MNEQEKTNAPRTEFVREDRYIVIKRSDLKAAPIYLQVELSLAIEKLAEHLPGRECLVIESDWPEYPVAWQMIESRMNGGAVVNQQVTTPFCLWKREQDSGFYETGCGQTWHFTDGTTPEENSAYFCHHCGKSLEVQRLIAYQVGDNDIVAAYDPSGAIEVLCTYNGYELDEFTVNEVVAVSDALLDSTEAFDQDEGKTVPLEKTLRQELDELTEPAYLHGWE
ncbi:hypothetical protein CDR19_04145 [Ectopseudomonas toyotomiensis]|uniref:Uncharacterized protein n=1 Tax=Ectopseudomonas toyotomiensis TaxID=554344 RepID=A0A1I5QZ82_9GAMM|nr:hypothetical protein [Pseudomonas toyotomiensis]PIA74263.1 hypothetical protein CDR19_04145 [Pseudomonas toyotomiensis]SFP51430.1 hypothetical protein SAMN05216177_103203 [Pseudomonas toyotomiensis]